MTENLAPKAIMIFLLTLVAAFFALPVEKRPMLQERTSQFRIHLGLDLKGGAEIRLEIPDSEAKKMQTPLSEAVEDARGVILKRIEDSGIVREPEIRREGRNRILIQLPGVTELEMEQIRELLTQLGSLEFRIVAPRTKGDVPQHLASKGILVNQEDEAQKKKQLGAAYEPPSVEVDGVDEKGKKIKRQKITHIWVPVRADKRGEFDGATEQLIELDDWNWTGDKIARVGIAMHELSMVPTFSIKGAQGKANFGQFTELNKGRPMAIIYNREIVSAPNINGRIDGEGIITGLGEDEVVALNKTLKSGSLKVKPKEIGSNFVGPSLGKYTIDNGRRAILLGFGLVIVFMVVYYLAAGLVASVALCMNLLLLYAGLVVFGATLTLPGIAGIILTVGMAVDANIIIFERIREERKAGKSLLQAVENGYERALSAIIDANITTLITAVILYWQGTGAIKGFAVTLLLGIIFSLFTALYVTRVIFEIGIRAGIFKTLTMLNFVGTPNIPFVGMRRAAMVFSLLLAVGGVLMFSNASEDIYGIDLQGGTLNQMALAGDASADDVRAALPDDLRAEVQEISHKAEEGVVPRTKHWYGIRARNLEIGYFVLNRKTLLEQVNGYLVKRYGQPRVDAHAKRLLPDGTTASDAKALDSLDFTELYRCLLFIDRAAELKMFTDLAKVQPTAARVPLKTDEASIEADRGDLVKQRLRDYLGEVNEERISPDYLRFVLQRAFDDKLVPDGVSGFGKTADGKGYKATLSLAKPATVEQVRAGLIGAGLPNDTTNAVAKEAVDGKAYDFDVSTIVNGPTQIQVYAMLKKIGDKAPALALTEPFPTSESIGKLVAKHQKQSAVAAVVMSLFAILAYIWIRFELIHGMAAIITLTHDVLFTLGAIAIFGGSGIVAVEINLPMLAAFLTIIGYSLNDTIVVFDRIRENLNKPGRHDLKSTINDSINQTLSRTLMTSLTTMIAVVTLFAVNYREGGVIEGFSFALIVGVGIGTYSSVFVATPILVEWQDRAERRAEKAREAAKAAKSAG